MSSAFSCYALSWRNIATLAHTTQDVVRSPLTSLLVKWRDFVNNPSQGRRCLIDASGFVDLSRAINVRFTSVDQRVHALSPILVLAGGRNDSRTGAEGCFGVGGIALFGWRLSLNDVSVATEATGYRADDA